MRTIHQYNLKIKIILRIQNWTTVDPNLHNTLLYKPNSFNNLATKWNSNKQILNKTATRRLKNAEILVTVLVTACRAFSALLWRGGGGCTRYFYVPHHYPLLSTTNYTDYLIILSISKTLTFFFKLTHTRWVQSPLKWSLFYHPMKETRNCCIAFVCWNKGTKVVYYLKIKIIFKTRLYKNKSII